MRALSALFLSAALVLPLAAPVLAQEAPSRTISVTGTGTIEAAPDMATLMIGVTTQGTTAAGGTPDEFRKLIATEIRNWKETAQKANIQPAK